MNAMLNAVRMCCLFLLFVAMHTATYAEYSFAGISWQDDETAIVKKLTDAGLLGKVPFDPTRETGSPYHILTSILPNQTVKLDTNRFQIVYIDLKEPLTYMTLYFLDNGATPWAYSFSRGFMNEEAIKPITDNPYLRKLSEKYGEPRIVSEAIFSAEWKSQGEALYVNQGMRFQSQTPPDRKNRRSENIGSRNDYCLEFLYVNIETLKPILDEADAAIEKEVESKKQVDQKTIDNL